MQHESMITRRSRTFQTVQEVSPRSSRPSRKHHAKTLHVQPRPTIFTTCISAGQVSFSKFKRNAVQREGLTSSAFLLLSLSSAFPAPSNAVPIAFVVPIAGFKITAGADRKTALATSLAESLSPYFCANSNYRIPGRHEILLKVTHRGAKSRRYGQRLVRIIRNSASCGCA